MAGMVFRAARLAVDPGQPAGAMRQIQDGKLRKTGRQLIIIKRNILIIMLFLDKNQTFR
jgi:hypothetical protein